MTRRRRGFAAASIAAALAVSPAPIPADAASSHGVSRLEVSFEVQNVNESDLICRSDELAYTIRGEIVGPTDLLLGRRDDLTATLYLHEFSFGKFFWTFDEVPGYDYAAQLARAGHVSVVVDRLGYDASDHPPGGSTCLGAQADVAAQIVGRLKSGDYTTRGRPSIEFERMLLAGHSVGGGVAELAAHSFADEMGIAGLILLAWADQGYSNRSIEQSVQQGVDCTPSGQPAEPGGPGGYAYFGREDEDFQQNVFNDTDPAVVAAATPLRNRDPCGDNATLARIAVVNATGVGEITVPVLLLFGEDDAVFQEEAAQNQADSFEGSESVTLRKFAGAGHALTLERAAGDVRAAVAGWLGEHDLVTPAGGGGPSGKKEAGGGQTSREVSARPALPVTGVGSMRLLGGALVLLALLGGRRLVGNP